VIDTDIFSADLAPGSPLAERYAPIITGRPAFISFQTVAELRYGALRRGWGEARMLKLNSKI
jgi:predicted nucleic acid-binding protein